MTRKGPESNYRPGGGGIEFMHKYLQNQQPLKKQKQ